MDVVQKVKDLSNLALDERGAEPERMQAAFGALRLIKQYNLLEEKKINVPVNIIEKFTDPAFVDAVVDRADKIASGFERIVGSVKKVSDLSRRTRRRRAATKEAK